MIGKGVSGSYRSSSGEVVVVLEARVSLLTDHYLPTQYKGLVCLLRGAKKKEGGRGKSQKELIDAQ